jgi:hypothetical protein
MRREPEKRKTPSDGAVELIHSLGEGKSREGVENRFAPSMDRVKL